MTPHASESPSRWRVTQGDALDVLRGEPSESVHCCVTSPPYWGLRDYGHDGQIGLEPTPAEYVARLVAVFAEVRRVLRDDGTLWLNLGDCYANDDKWGGSSAGGKNGYCTNGTEGYRARRASGLKRKDLAGIPWRVALALQDAGWWLRCDVVWAKRTCMPESVSDRPTRSHEYMFLLSKSDVYHYDADAVREPDVGADHPRTMVAPLDRSEGHHAPHRGIRTSGGRAGEGRNLRSVWFIATEPFPGAHFAVMPTALVKPCVLAGCPKGGTVLDPFMGSGTVGAVAIEQGCSFHGIELNRTYIDTIAVPRLEAASAGRLW